MLVNSLNVSKPLCSSKVTNCNVCNVCKPSHVSKAVCFETTGRNVCKVSSVSQLVKPSAISKPVLSNNVCNVDSISQLVKSFNVTKAVFSSNANNCHL